MRTAVLHEFYAMHQQGIDAPGVSRDGFAIFLRPKTTARGSQINWNALVVANFDSFAAAEFHAGVLNAELAQHDGLDGAK